MKILDIDKKPFHSGHYMAVKPGNLITEAQLPFLRARVDFLPGGLSALLACADLQGRTRTAEDFAGGGLLGIQVAEELGVLCELGIMPKAKKVGILLAGDLFAREGLDRRGGRGDVRQVWGSFAAGFRWVAGIAGNHDFFYESPSVPDLKEFLRKPGIHFLDGNIVDLDGLRIGGVSGIIGNPRKPFRHTEQDYLTAIRSIIAARPDLMILHDGPDCPTLGLEGKPEIRKALNVHKELLLIRGHKHWDPPLVELSQHVQILNVHERIVVMAA